MLLLLLLSYSLSLRNQRADSTGRAASPADLHRHDKEGRAAGGQFPETVVDVFDAVDAVGQQGLVHDEVGGGSGVEGGSVYPHPCHTSEVMEGRVKVGDRKVSKIGNRKGVSLRVESIV